MDENNFKTKHRTMEYSHQFAGKIINFVCLLIEKYLQFTAETTAQTINISIGSICTIVTEKLNWSKYCTLSVPILMCQDLQILLRLQSKSERDGITAQVFPWKKWERKHTLTSIHLKTNTSSTAATKNCKWSSHSRSRQVIGLLKILKA